MASLVNYAALNNGRVGTEASSSDSNSATNGAEVGTGYQPSTPISMAEYIALHGNTVALDNGHVDTGTSSSDSGSTTNAGIWRSFLNSLISSGVPLTPSSIAEYMALHSDTVIFDSSTSDIMTSSSDSDTATSGAEVGTGSDTINIPTLQALLQIQMLKATLELLILRLAAPGLLHLIPTVQQAARMSAARIQGQVIGLRTPQ